MNHYNYSLTKAKLTQLYIQQKLSSESIANLLGCSHVTILNHLTKHNIPRRSTLGTRRPIVLSKKTLGYLYLKKKLTHKEIAQKFGHSEYGIERWMKIYGIRSRNYSEANTIYSKHNFSGNLTEKAYLVGFRLGDLNVAKAKELIQVRCSSTILPQANLFRKLFRSYGNPHIWTAKRGTYEMVTLLNKSFDFLLPKKDTIENWILKNGDYFLSFLAGYSDAEGSFYIRKPRPKIGKIGWGTFEIQTYDKNILSLISNKLSSNYPIETNFRMSRLAGNVDKRGTQNNKSCWQITINKKQSLWNFIKIIEPYLKHKNKIRDLKRVRKNLIDRNTLPYCKKPISF